MKEFKLFLMLFLILFVINCKGYYIKKSNNRKLSEQQHLCPASINKNHFNAGLLSYPIDLFRPSSPSSSSHPSSSSSSSHSSSHGYNCTFITGKFLFIIISSLIFFYDSKFSFFLVNYRWKRK